MFRLSPIPIMFNRLRNSSTKRSMLEAYIPNENVTYQKKISELKKDTNYNLFWKVHHIFQSISC